MKISDIKYSDNEKCILDFYCPENADKYPVYVYVHGGGIVGGDKKEVTGLAEYLLQKGIATVSVNYRMYPEAKFPDYLIDCVQAVKWLKDNYSEKIEYMIFGGTSAGGYISMMLFFNKAYFETIGVKVNDFNGYIFNAGQPTSHFNYLNYDLKMDSRRVYIDEGAPIYYIDKDFEPEQPKIQIFTADNDMYNRREQTDLLVRTMTHFKFPAQNIFTKIYANSTHCSYCNNEEYLIDTYEFIRRCK